MSGYLLSGFSSARGLRGRERPPDDDYSQQAFLGTGRRVSRIRFCGGRSASRSACTLLPVDSCLRWEFASSRWVGLAAVTPKFSAGVAALVRVCATAGFRHLIGSARSVPDAVHSFLRKLPLPTFVTGWPWLMRLHDPSWDPIWNCALGGGADRLFPHADLAVPDLVTSVGSECPRTSLSRWPMKTFLVRRVRRDVH